MLLASLALVLSAAPTPRGQYVSEAGCAECHPAASRAWANSHHALAMQPATASTVRGDFRGARFTAAGVTSRFATRDGGFFVTTDGPDGRLAQFQVTHTLGVDPLQQYLVDLPGGRKQALALAWDTRRRRWFHLYPQERVDFRDELHWTQPSQTWNFMCGECHATGYRKGYDEPTRTYRTTAARFEVGCQGCHGPASRHAAWAASAGRPPAPRPVEVLKRDFDVDLSAREAQPQVEVCGRCHARRASLTASHADGEELLDTHLPALLTEGLHAADGQPEAEGYEYGSFLQSRMHQRGVRCSDCHEPHLGQTRAPGNALCVGCHRAGPPGARPGIDVSGLQRKDYDTPAHHFHRPGTPGSACVDCHAPTRTYMVVHARHDHGFRIPRPDLTVAIGTPNACTGCHAKEGAAWAVKAVAAWYGPHRRQEPHFGLALDAGRRGRPGAVAGLLALVGDRAQPAIVRATALELLARYPGRSTLDALRRSLGDPSSLVRRAAAEAFGLAPDRERLTWLPALLADPVRAVRIEAARGLASGATSLAPGDRPGFERALAELEAALTENADRPQALTARGTLALALGDPAAAERHDRQALALDARFVQAWVNLADLHRATGREADAERTLREGLRQVPGAAALHEALGLALVRQGKRPQALASFAAAAAAAPGVARHTYVHAVALDGAGRRREAVERLEAMARRVGDRDVLLTLAAFAQEAGDRAGARQHLEALAAINPDDPGLPPGGLR